MDPKRFFNIVEIDFECKYPNALYNQTNVMFCICIHFKLNPLVYCGDPQFALVTNFLLSHVEKHDLKREVPISHIYLLWESERSYYK